MAMTVISSAIVISGLIVALYMYAIDKYALTYYGDAASHLVGARKLFDWSENPGWSQIGTVWLPLPHFLLVPPSFVDSLFFTGFAGLAISLPSTALTSVMIFKIAQRIMSKVPNVNTKIVSYAAITTALLYGLNPNILYLGISAMTEAPFMLFFVSSAFCIIKWRDKQISGSATGDIKYLMLASLLITAATLCRYEGWILPIFLIPFSVVSTIFVHRNSTTARSDKPTVGRSAIASLIIVIFTSALSASGIIFWLAYNAVNYGDAFEFANAEYYSAASQALNRSFRETLFLQPANIGSVYGQTTLLMFGPVIIGAAAVGFYQYRSARKKGMPRFGYLYSYLALPPIFTIITLLIGIGEMAFWFNSRFVVLLAPITMLMVGFYVSKQPRRIATKPLFMILVISSLFAFFFVQLYFSAIVTLADAFGGFRHKQSPYAVSLGEELRTMYDGLGSIMIVTGSPQEHRILLTSAISLDHFNTFIESNMWKKSFYEPWIYDNEFVVIAKDPDSDGVAPVKYWNEHRNTLDQHYDMIFANQYFEIWKLS